jgi:hypothetical protein
VLSIFKLKLSGVKLLLISRSFCFCSGSSFALLSLGILSVSVDFPLSSILKIWLIIPS